MTHDEAFARGFRWAFRNIPLFMLVIVLAFGIMAVLGYWWELTEAVP